MLKKHSILSYSRQSIDENDIAAVNRVLKSPFLTQGPEVEAFEKALCEYTGSAYAVAVANGTAALHLAVCALGIEPDKEGITSGLTFLASANALIYNGLTATFADIDEKTLCVDPSEVEKNINKDTRLLISVHFAGRPAQMQRLSEIAKEKGLKIIEDAAHAIGSAYPDGGRVGNCRYSDMTIFSFHPLKTITTGEGGAVMTNDEELYHRLKRLRAHGVTKEATLLKQNPGSWYYEMQELGFNYRLTDIQAALGISQLSKIDRFVSRRRQIVEAYNEAFRGVFWFNIPDDTDMDRIAFHLYAARIDFNALGKSRAEVMDMLRERGIATQVHYIPVYLQPYYREQFGYGEGMCPHAEAYYEQALSLPLYPAMTDGDVECVVRAVRELEKR